MTSGKVTAKTPEQIEGMRASGDILAHALSLIVDAVEPGVTTDELNTVADEFIRDHGGHAIVSRSAGRVAGSAAFSWQYLRLHERRHRAWHSQWKCIARRRYHWR